jgi:hypothetical protein
MAKKFTTRKTTEAKDMSADKRTGIAEGSRRDQNLDRQRGLPADTKTTKKTTRRTK